MRESVEEVVYRKNRSGGLGVAVTCATQDIYMYIYI